MDPVDQILNSANQNTSGSIVVKDWHEFKMMAKQFFDAAPSLNLDELDNAHKCLGLAYMSFDFPNTTIGNMQREVEAPIIMKLAMDAHLKRLIELEAEHD